MVIQQCHVTFGPETEIGSSISGGVFEPLVPKLDLKFRSRQGCNAAFVHGFHSSKYRPKLGGFLEKTAGQIADSQKIAQIKPPVK